MKVSRFSFCVALIGCAVPVMASASEVLLRSDLPDYRVTMLSSLPPAPEPRLQECRTAPAQHPAGKAVAALGWQVIAESRLGDYALVTFASGSSPGMQGLCDFTNGNLGVFEGERLIGLYWGTTADNSLFGALQSEREGAVDLITSSFPAVPVAELVQKDGSILLQARPAILPGCEGRVDLPQLWQQPIGQMRESLIALGWAPAAQVAQDPVASEMQTQGFPETESCSGTGVNYCSYAYERPEATLRVITVGELGEGYQPSVADYEVTCQGAAKDEAE